MTDKQFGRLLAELRFQKKEITWLSREKGIYFTKCIKDFDDNLNFYQFKIEDNNHIVFEEVHYKKDRLCRARRINFELDKATYEPISSHWLALYVPKHNLWIPR